MNINSNKIKSPGQLKIHYSPGIPIRLNAKTVKDTEALLLLKKKKNEKKFFLFIN